MQNMGGAGWRLFDANYGEFTAKDDNQFATFVTWYMDATNYDTRYTAATRIIGVNPAIHFSGIPAMRRPAK